MQFSERTRAIFQALLVTFLWSTSWVLIKKSIHEIPPLTFAAARYFIAFLVMLPGLKKHKVRLRSFRFKTLRNLLLLGLVFYTLTQGGQFLTLKYLDAMTFSLLLNFTTVLVAVFSIFFLNEKPAIHQWMGILIFFIGVMVYFSSSLKLSGSPVGFLLAAATVCANAIAAMLGRSINREKSIPPYVVTVISMGIGAFFLIGISQVVDGLPSLKPVNMGVILWLAVVNTAFAFTLWNKSLQVLTAAESSMINNTMLIQIAVLAWLFLGEELNLVNVTGLLLASGGILLANFFPAQSKNSLS